MWFDSQNYRDVSKKWDATVNLTEAYKEQMERIYEQLSQGTQKI